MDIVERLRAPENILNRDRADAADEIERLREACHRNLDITNTLMQDNMRLREINDQYQMRQNMLVKALDVAFDDLYARDARDEAEKITRVLEELEL